MIPAQKVIDLLQKKITFLETNKTEELSGFAVIYPPEGEPVDIVMMGNISDEASFYQWLRDRLVQSKDQTYGGIRIPTR